MRLFLPFACFLVAVTCRAQESGGEYSISGVVVNSLTGEPVRQALITGYGMLESPDTELTVEFDPVLTDASGVFHLPGLGAAEYSLRADKPGFALQNETEISAKLGPSREGIMIRLTPLGRIFGKVVDGDGEPAAFVEVRALQSQIVDGRRVFSKSLWTTTDDLGRYRFWHPSPGTYYIQAAGRSGGTRYYSGPAFTILSPHEGFEPVVYPAAADWRSATPVTVTPGTTMEADIRVTMRPAFRVSGTIRNHDMDGTITIQVLRGGIAIAARTTLNLASGRFAIYDLVPGTYVVRATQDQGATAFHALQEIRIGEGDVDGAVLTMSPGAEVKIVVHGIPPAAAEEQEADGTQPDPHADAGVIVQLIDADVTAETPSVYSAMSAGDGSLVVSGLPEGRYRVRIFPVRCYVASAITGGQDVLRGAVLTVVPGVAPPVIEADLRFDGGRVTGTVATEAAGADQRVVLAPVVPGGEAVVAQVESGRFEFTDVAPGEYRAYLLADQAAVEYANPDVLSALRGGENVRVTANGKTEVVLRELAR